MAAVPASITVTFTSYYAGLHRVCYRQGGSGPYTCATVNCAGGGASCSYVINIVVDNETCTPVNFDGYVQAACEDINSTNNRVPFTATFTPSPSCKRYEVTCNTVGVLSAIVNTPGGACYNPASPPSVSFSGGGGSGAAATAVIGNGAITARSLVNAGAGYNNGTWTNVNLTGGSGSGAKATVVIAGGIMVSLVITAAGSGYTTGNLLGVNPANIGGSAPSTPISISITSNLGLLIGISITNAGSGYTSVPTITVAPGGCEAGTATAVLGGCTELVNPGCAGITPVIISADTIPLGHSVDICATGGTPSVPSDFTITPNGDCLCNCQSTTITATGGDPGPYTPSILYWYNDCNGNGVSGVLYPNGSPSSVTVCAVTGSVVTQSIQGAVATVTFNGSCP